MIDRPLMGDEGAHVRQIEDLVRWMQTGAPFTPLHPAIPGYHFVIAAVAAVVGASGLFAYRAISVGLNMLGPLAAFSLARGLSKDRRLSTLRMGQVFFLAVAFPFLPLLYTDLFSAGLVLLCFGLVSRERFALAGVAGTLSIAVRQNNVLWLGLAFVVSVGVVWRSWGFRVAADRQLLLRTLGRLWTFLAGFVGVTAFVVWNGGELALADQAAHPPFSFHLGNVWVVLITAFFVLLPHGVARAPSLLQVYREHPDAVWLGGCAVAALYLVTFTATHPYNFLPWWLHNKLVLLATSSPLWKLLFLIPVLYQTLLFASTPLWRKELVFLYPVAVVYLGASWLIEPRYFVIPLFLYLLFRKPDKLWVEGMLVAWNAALGGILFWGVSRGLWLP